jgi:hypothetical protein
MFRVVILFLLMSACFADEKGSKESETKKGKQERYARELANPNAVLTSLKFKLRHYEYTGKLPEADAQNGTLLLLQPTLPFPQKNGKTLYVRPGFPLHFDQPFYDSTDSDMESRFGLGDMSLDVQYGTTEDNGVLWSVGFANLLPTATENELGFNKFTAGPGFQLGHLGKKHVVGFYTNHQWDVAGSGDQQYNVTSTQLFGVYLPGGGWNVGSVPTINYDHDTDKWTIPLNLAFGKTVLINDRPWKVNFEINYFVERDDIFAPEWMFGITIAPVLENIFARWF